MSGDGVSPPPSPLPPPLPKRVLREMIFLWNLLESLVFFVFFLWNFSNRCFFISRISGNIFFFLMEFLESLGTRFLLESSRIAVIFIFCRESSLIAGNFFFLFNLLESLGVFKISNCWERRLAVSSSDDDAVNLSCINLQDTQRSCINFQHNNSMSVCRSLSVYTSEHLSILLAVISQLSSSRLN